jgi:serine/threonine protein kinase
VLVSVDGKVKLLDFGIAKLVESEDEWSAVRRASRAR